MNNIFKITISAVDKATAVVRSVKNSFSQIMRPVTDLKSVVSSLGKETGLDKVGKSIFEISNATSSLASHMAGAFPALAGGLSVAALATMAGRWGDLGAEINKTSRSIGISTEQLQQFRAVARRADVAPEAMDNALKSLGSTMEDVFFHRASPEAITALRQMGIEFHKTARGAPDIATGLLDIANATKQLESNPQAQRKLLESLGLSEDLLPVLRLGAKGIEEYRAAYQKTHGMISEDDIRRAETFKKSIIDLGDALGGLGLRAIANASLLTRVFNTTTAFIAGEGTKSLAPGLARRVLNSASVADKKTGDLLTGALPGGIVTDLARSWLNKGTKAAPSPPSDAVSSAPLSAGIYIDAPAPSSVDAPAPSVSAVAEAAAAQSPKVSIELLLKNAPPGTQIRARTSDGQHVPARVEYSMPTTVTP